MNKKCHSCKNFIDGHKCKYGNVFDINFRCEHFKPYIHVNVKQEKKDGELQSQILKRN